MEAFFCYGSIMEQQYSEQKKQILKQINDLYKDGDLFKVIDLLENCQLDFDLCLQLVRTYINVARQSGDPYTLFSKAQRLLDNFSKQGHDNSYYQFYQGCILFNSGLIADSIIRFEQALKFVPATDPTLLCNIQIYKDKATSLETVASFNGCSKDEELLLLSHYKKHFNNEPMCYSKVGSVNLYVIKPSDNHDYNMLVTTGLSGKNQKSKDGLSEDFELCFALPKDFSTSDPKEVPFEISMFEEVVTNLICQKDFIGFGYYLEKDRSFSKTTAFNGVMFCGLGDYKKEAQCMSIGDKTISFLEMIPLRPMELNFRKNNSANALLELFKEQQIMLTPFIKTRDDVCRTIS